MKRKRAVGDKTSSRKRSAKPRRRRVSLLRCLILSCLVAAASTPLFALDPQALDLAMRGLRNAEAPRLVGDTLILSYQAPESGRVRFVGARFASESYRILHTFTRNPYKVFVLDYPVPEKTLQIRYRLVVDGLWINDPFNPSSEMDDLGNAISVVTLDREPDRPIVNPRIEPDGRITFEFHGPTGHRVTIQGDFNNWDPFIDQLEETDPGVYKITLRVLPGSHWYRFFTDGRRLLDRYNVRSAADPDGDPVSYFELPS